jgi:phosphoenolpyruvate-protein kinase (PTS system EI component)
MNKIDANLTKYKINSDSKQLLSFIKGAIENREYSKFIFTKSLSQVLYLIEKFSKRFEITREDAAFIDIKLISEMYSTLDYKDVGTALKDNIAFNKKNYEYTEQIKLPTIILNPEDIYGFYLEEDEPNFITLNSIKSNIILEKDIITENLNNKIVFIESADPGYDFLFTKNIGGLITQFGGANSHMAIRCAELGLPAVIGSGEKNFSFWSNAQVLELNCADRQVRIIS